MEEAAVLEEGPLFPAKTMQVPELVKEGEREKGDVPRVCLSAGSTPGEENDCIPLLPVRKGASRGKC